MKLCLKITVGLLLLVQAVSSAALTDSTNLTKPTIDPSWLRDLPKNLNTVASEEGMDKSSESGFDSGNDFSGIPSGGMAFGNEEEENMGSSTDQDANEFDETADVPATTEPLNDTAEQPENKVNDVPPVNATTEQPENKVNNVPPVNATTEQPENKVNDVPPVNATTDQTNSSNVNATEEEEEFENSITTPPKVQNATSSPDHSNHTELDMNTLAPKVNATQEPAAPEEDTEAANGTISTNTTTTATAKNNDTADDQGPTVLPDPQPEPEKPDNPKTTTAKIVPATDAPEKGNDTEKSAASGSDSDAGLASDAGSRRHSTWGAVFGTAVAVVCVGLVAYVILKHKHQKGFSHRKLVEEFPSDPVLRLDNSEPLDLNFSGSAYYNPALQGDNIQMSSLPGRH